jgi:hypothetical protein
VGGEAEQWGLCLSKKTARSMAHGARNGWFRAWLAPLIFIVRRLSLIERRLIEMADPELWCLIQGDTDPFPVTVLDISIGRLKEVIKEKNKENIKVDAPKLALWKVRYFKGFVLIL